VSKQRSNNIFPNMRVSLFHLDGQHDWWPHVYDNPALSLVSLALSDRVPNVPHDDYFQEFQRAYHASLQNPPPFLLHCNDEWGWSTWVFSKWQNTQILYKYYKLGFAFFHWTQVTTFNQSFVRRSQPNKLPSWTFHFTRCGLRWSSSSQINCIHWLPVAQTNFVFAEWHLRTLNS
jgi:hypothetical protein